MLEKINVYYNKKTVCKMCIKFIEEYLKTIRTQKGLKLTKLMK
jgi:hypothetical protein